MSGRSRSYADAATPTTKRRRFASIADAAAYADVSPRTIRRYIAAGRLTGYRVGPRLVKVDLADLDAIMRPIPTAGW
jgi:excisionase family DNA binding protein